MNVVAMENFLRDKDLWIVGSVCLVASILWRRFWNLFTYKRKRDTSPESSSIDIQVKLMNISKTEIKKLCFVLIHSYLIVFK